MNEQPRFAVLTRVLPLLDENLTKATTPYVETWREYRDLADFREFLSGPGLSHLLRAPR